VILQIASTKQLYPPEVMISVASVDLQVKTCLSVYSVARDDVNANDDYDERHLAQFEVISSLI
jgi:hypothetical protein